MGQAIRVMLMWVNWRQEEPNDCGGGRQLFMNGTSRVTGGGHARICERLGAKFPGPTRRRSVMLVPTATSGDLDPSSLGIFIDFGGRRRMSPEPMK
jgi:hypothetical protein